MHFLAYKPFVSLANAPAGRRRARLKRQKGADASPIVTENGELTAQRELFRRIITKRWR